MFTEERIEITDTEARSDCHIFPCFINHNGKIDRTKFELEDTPEPRAWFRGRPLQGYTVDLSKYGYKGYCIVPETVTANEVENETSDAELSSQEEPPMKETRLVQTGKVFDKMTVWEHGKPPSKLDPWAHKLEELLAFSRFMIDDYANNK